MAGIEKGVDFPIYATDQFSGAFDKLKAKTLEAKSGIESLVATLGIGFSVGGLALLAKGAIDAMDHLGDLSKTTRINATDLAGLGFAAKQSGSDLESVASAVNKLGVNMGKSSEKFAALGVNARDPIEAFKQLADVTNAMTDPQQRAAVLAEALGKSWQQAAPLLAEGSAKIGEMVEKGKALSGITEENVRLADELNDKWGELVGNGGMVNATVGAMLPLLNQLADDLLKLKGEGSGGGFSFLAEILRVIIVLGGNVAFVLKAIGIEIGGIAAQVKSVLEDGNWDRFNLIGDEMRANAAAARKDFDAWEQSIMAVGTTTKSTTSALDAMDQVQRRMASEASAAARAFLEAEKRKRDAEEAAKKAAADALHMRELDNRGWIAYIEEQIAEYERGLKEEERLGDDFWKHRKQMQELDDKGWVAFIEEQTKEYEDGLKAMADKQPSHLEVMQKQWITMWENVADAAGNFFSDLVMNGRSAFDNLRKWVKQLLADMIALFAKRWILNMAAGGSVLGAAGDAFAGGSGSDSMAGSAINWLGSAYTSYAAGTGVMGGTLGATAGGAFAQGAMGQGVGVWATGSAGEMGLGMSGVYEALAAIPVWGWIAMAVVAIGAWIANSKAGGPKVGGSFFSGGDVPGTDNGRFFTPNQGDPFVHDIVTATLSSYGAFAQRLGGTAGTFNFGLGFDHDPHGSAQSRVSSGLYGANGNLIYGSRDVSMDDKAVPAALQLEAKRAFVAMLQNTDLADSLDKLFASIDVSTATSEQLDAVLAQAQLMKGIIDTLSLWDVGLTIESIQSMVREGETLGQTFDKVSAAMQQYYQLFYSEEERHKMGMDQLTKMFKAMGLTLPTTREGFRALVDSIDVTTEAGAKLWRWLIEIAPAFANLVPAIDTGATVIASAADTINVAAQALGQTMSGSRGWDDAFHNYYAGRGAREGLGQSLTASLLGNNSPLDPMSKLNQAEKEYYRILGLAQGGDVTATGQLGGARNTLIEIARSIFGSSSPFVELFTRTFNESAGVAGIADYNTQMLAMSKDSVQYQAQMADTLVDVKDLLIEIRDRGPVAVSGDGWAAR